MFDPKEISAYRSISAPDGLRDKVLSSCANVTPRKKSPMSYMKWVSSLAASLVLVALLTVFAANEFGSFSVSTGDGELPRERSVAYVPDEASQGISLLSESGEVVISLAVDGNVTLSVSEGTLYIVSPDGEEILFEGPEYDAEGKTSVYWSVPTDDAAKTFEMTARGTFKTEKLLLAFDESQMKWTITRTGK